MKFDWRKRFCFLFVVVVVLTKFSHKIFVIIMLEVCMWKCLQRQQSYSGVLHEQAKRIACKGLKCDKHAYVYNYVSCCNAVYSRKANFDVIHRQ